MLKFCKIDPEINQCYLLLKQNAILQMNPIAMNNLFWTTNTLSLSDFEVSRFCCYFLILFDSCRHSLLSY